LDKNNQLIVDLINGRKEFVLCEGGQGGRGSNRNPATTDPGAGQTKLVVLDYRIPVDVVIVGFANRKKTTLFNLITGQENRVAHYPFTTATCALGHFNYKFNKITLLDTPPVRETKDNPGKNRFLRHLFRSKIILILGENKDYKQIKEEIDKFDPDFLGQKKVFYLPANIGKIDINQLKEKIHSYLEKL
ncbi:MAG: 50S ribosome-binding GTPase, partial [Candidatus Omnitrophica bacterium]|nr:50S ribosome-binding GTPase [Candidatus Omnitrophota bacterium]